jgi:hypothetical protein
MFASTIFMFAGLFILLLTSLAKLELLRQASMKLRNADDPLRDQSLDEKSKFMHYNKSPSRYASLVDYVSTENGSNR